MGHWGIFACILVGSAGVLVFLRVVADELAVLERLLEYHKKVEEERQAKQDQEVQQVG